MRHEWLGSSAAGPSAQVSGSDQVPSPITEALEQDGITVTTDQSAAGLKPEIDLVIATAALPPTTRFWRELLLVGLKSSATPTHWAGCRKKLLAFQLPEPMAKAPPVRCAVTPWCTPAWHPRSSSGPRSPTRWRQPSGGRQNPHRPHGGPSGLDGGRSLRIQSFFSCPPPQTRRHFECGRRPSGHLPQPGRGHPRLRRLRPKHPGCSIGRAFADRPRRSRTAVK